MSKKYVIICFLAIIALAGFFRLWEIKTIPPGFYPDEAMNGNNAMEAWENTNFSAPGGPTLGWKWFYSENNGREGLWINMMSPLIAFFGNEPWVPRSLSAIIGILTVIGLYFLTRELFKSERVGLLASFFLATSFWHINFSRISFRAIMAPFFLVWSFYFLWKTLGNSVSKRKRSFQVGLSGLLFGLGFHTYIAYRVAPLLLIIPFVLLWRNGPEPSRRGGSYGAGRKNLIFIFLLFAFIAALPLGLYFLRNPQDFFGRTSQLSIFSNQSPVRDFGVNILKTIGMFFYRGDYNWRHNLPGSPQLWWPVAILFLIGIWESIKRAAHRMKIVGVGALPERSEGKGISDFQTMRGESLFLLLWLIIMLIPTVISNEGIPHALRAIVAIPPTMIFAALGLDLIIVKISNWLRKNRELHPENTNQLSRIKKQLAILLIVFLIGIASNAFNRYFLRWAPSPYVAEVFNENYAELGKYLDSLPEQIPKYVIVNAAGVDVPVKSAFPADNGASRGIPMPAQTVMFITKTFLPEWQAEKNIFYINPSAVDSLAASLKQKEHFYIAMLENDQFLRLSFKQKFPDLKSEGTMGGVILRK